MENTEYQERLARIIEQYKGYEGLSANPDFIRWQHELLLPTIEYLRDSLLTSDRSVPNWKELVCDRLVAYQETVRIYEVLFKQSIEVARQARADLKKLEEGPQ